ncbi:hypothetical protein TNCV_3703711 [Trichonephila clavipes]|nr:hypothetical protein TNCV_3703711 [Trichonephila clavipes]
MPNRWFYYPIMFKSRITISKCNHISLLHLISMFFSVPQDTVKSILMEYEEPRHVLKESVMYSCISLHHCCTTVTVHLFATMLRKASIMITELTIRAVPDVITIYVDICQATNKPIS